MIVSGIMDSSVEKQIQEYRHGHVNKDHMVYIVMTVIKFIV